jgi:hypothetical protein
MLGRPDLVLSEAARIERASPGFEIINSVVGIREGRGREFKGQDSEPQGRTMSAQSENAQAGVRSEALPAEFGP